MRPGTIKRVAVLFARSDSIYKTFPECDVYDKDRNALTFDSCLPVVAHPPCRAWGRLRHFAKPEPGEKELAIWAIEQIRKNGGVLEHPAASRLWPEMNLPAPGKFDKHGGWTLGVFQWWWGHRAEKKTKLYIYGVSPQEIPLIPFRLGEPTHVVSMSKRKYRPNKPEISKKEREATPVEFAKWLVELAKRTKLNISE